MRTYYLAILGLDPKIRESVRESLKTKDGQRQMQHDLYTKLHPLIEKRWGKEQVDFESWYPTKVMFSEDYFAQITRDDNSAMGFHAPDELEAEEVLLPNCEWDENDIFVTEDYEKDHLFVIFTVDV